MGRGPIKVTTKPRPKPGSGGRGRGSIKGGTGGRGGKGGSGRGGSNKSVMNRLGGGVPRGGGSSSSSAALNRPVQSTQNIAVARGGQYTKAPKRDDGPGNYDSADSPLSGGNSPRNSTSATSSSAPGIDRQQSPALVQAMNPQYTPAPTAPYHAPMGGQGGQPIYHAPPVTGPAAGPGGGVGIGGGGAQPPGGGGNPPGGGGGNPGQPFGGMQVAGGPPPQPNRAQRILRKIKPESKKGYAAYGALFLIAAGGASVPAWYPAIKDASDDNGSKTPTAGDDKVNGSRSNGAKDPVTGIDLKRLVTPADALATSQIDPSTFLLFETLEIKEQGATELSVNGTWKVTNTGILSFVPDQNADFGTATICYTVKDKSGRTSGFGEIQIVYGPFVGNIEKLDLAPDKKTAGFAVGDVYEPASSAAGARIDRSSLQIVRRLDGVEEIGDTISIEDGSTWRAENGSITFEPSPGFISTNVNVGFIVRDQDGLLSNEGQIALFFKPKAMMKDPNPDPNPDPDPAKPQLGYMPEIAVNTQDVAFTISSVGELQASSLEISGSPTGPFGKTLDAGREGQWNVSGNRLNFARGAGFREAPTTIYYRATSKDGVQSDTFALTLGIFPPPVANDVTKDGLRAVVDVLPSTRVTYTREGNTIDADSLRFLAVAPDDPADPTPVLSDDGKMAVVEGEGTWSVVSRTDKVKFVPVRGFNRAPIPMFYTVLDTKGSESNPAKIVLNKAADDVQKMIADMMQLTQREFASRLKSVLAGKPLDEALVVTYQLRNLFFGQMNEAQRLDIRTAPGISQAEQDQIFATWMDADFNFGALVDATESVRQMTLGLQVPMNNLGARVLRLEEIMRALDKYFDAFEAAV